MTHDHGQQTGTPTALITGASRGLGLALARALAARGWSLIIDARGAEMLGAVERELSAVTRVIALAGDVTDPVHRAALARAANDLSGLDVVVNNASILGPSPQPALLDYPLDVLEAVFRANVIAPLGILQAVRDALKPGARVLNITSDASVEAYAGWGGYGASKAALDQLSAVLAVERPDLRVYAIDPGDMRTQMQQEAYPGEDISDRPLPETRLPALLRWVDGEFPAGRYKVGDYLNGDYPAEGVRWLNLVLKVDDFDAALRFYRDGLGMTVAEEWHETGHGVLLDAGRGTLELVDDAQAAEVDRVETGAVTDAPVRLALNVPDVRSAAAAVEAHGGRVIAAAVETDWGSRNQRVSAPDGLPITLFQPADEKLPEGAS